MTRFALALVFALAALGITGAGAIADSSSDVMVSATVYSSSGTSSDSVTLAELQADPTRCPAYSGPQNMNELGRQGFVPVSLPPSGPQTGTWALSTVLGCLQTPIPLSAVQGIAVLSGDGSLQAGAASQIKPADLVSPSDFSDASQAPVVEALGSLNQYDRPWRGGGDQDFLDEVQETENDQPAPISIEVFEGPLLTVTVHASRTSVPAGKAVSFQATVSGANGSALSYAWDFGGGATNSTAAAPRTRFDAAGRYEVTVQVTDQAGGGGIASIPITVGAKPPAATGSHPRSGAGNSLSSHSPTGPLSSAGNHPGGRPGYTKTGGSSPSGTNHSGGATPSQTTPTSPTTTPTTSAPASPSPAATTHTRPPAPRRSAPSPLTGSVPVTPPGGPTVAGQLISDVIPLGADASPLVHVVPATAASAPPARRTIRATPLTAIGAALAVVLLLGLGAGRELGWRPSWRTLRAGN